MTRWTDPLLFRNAQTPGKKAIVVGFDGLDPRRVRAGIEAGTLPSFAALDRHQALRHLGTTIPALSPVAWSTFATGVNPGKHGITCFTRRADGSYAPALSSARYSETPTRKVGSRRVQPPPTATNLQRSRPFWHHLTKDGVPATILRVPITFPPKAFDGRLLAGMVAPDLLGTQGTFWIFAAKHAPPSQMIRGQLRPLLPRGKALHGVLPSPPDLSGRAAPLPFSLEPKGTHEALLRIQGQRALLKKGRDHTWTRIHFGHARWARVPGLLRVRLLEGGSNPKLYIGPIQNDPWRPRWPIAHPPAFSAWLGKEIGPYATLGLAEDLWAYQAQVLDAEGFLEQLHRLHDEREEMLLRVLDAQQSGLVVCVFDGTDRAQHMFERESAGDLGLPGQAIDEIYQRADLTLSKVLERIDLNDPDTLLMVLSDHGFAPFKRQIDLNRWLQEEGALALTKEGKIDWDNTLAFTLGLTSIRLNLLGREPHGRVDPSHAQALSDHLAKKLAGLADPVTGEKAIREVFLTREIYQGPYVDEASEIIVGFEAGWRTSWKSASGEIDDQVFSDNDRLWSGDHAVHPDLVPGVLLSSHPLSTKPPRLEDLAPTLLDFFGTPSPRFLEGAPLLRPRQSQD